MLNFKRDLDLDIIVMQVTVKSHGSGCVHLAKKSGQKMENEKDQSEARGKHDGQAAK